MTLFPDYTALIIMGIVACLVPVLKRLLFEPVARTIEARERERSEAEERFNAATRADEEATRASAEAVAAARRAGYREMDQQRRLAAERANKALAAARRKAAETLEAGQVQLDQQVAEASATLGSAAADLGDELMTRLLGRA